MGQRRPNHRHGLRRRDPAAAADHPLQGRLRRADGHPVLAPGEPHRRLGVVAGARAGEVGLSEALEARVHRHRAEANARDHPVGNLFPRSAARDTFRLGQSGQRRRPRSEREVGPLVHGDPRRDRQSGLQPGRKRRVPGRGQPAIPDLLLREAAVFHGRRWPLQPGGKRPGRCLDAVRGAHPQDRRSDLRREAHRLGGTGHVREPDRDRSGARENRDRARSAVGQGEALSGRAGSD